MTRPPAFRIVTDEDGETAEIRLVGELDLATAPELVAEIRLVGELDLATAPELVAEFERIRAFPALRCAVLDLRDLAFLDSTGLEAIVRFDGARA